MTMPWITNRRSHRSVDRANEGLAGLRTEVVENGCKAGLHDVPFDVGDLVRPRLEELACSIFGRIDVPPGILVRREAALQVRLAELASRIQTRRDARSSSVAEAVPPRWRVVALRLANAGLAAALAGLAMVELGAPLGIARIGLLAIASLLLTLNIHRFAAVASGLTSRSGNCLDCLALLWTGRKLARLEALRFRQEELQARIDGWVDSHGRMLACEYRIHEELAARARLHEGK